MPTGPELDPVRIFARALKQRGVDQRTVDYAVDCYRFQNEAMVVAAEAFAAARAERDAALAQLDALRSAAKRVVDEGPNRDWDAWQDLCSAIGEDR